MKKLIILLLFFVAFTSCRSVKRTTEKNTATTAVEKTDTSKDSVTVTKISEKIDESVSLSLRTNNKIVDSIIRSRLKGFQTAKKSGGNAFSASFDYDKLALEIKAAVAESVQSKTDVNTDTSFEKSFTEKTDEYISKKIRSIPVWVYILLGLYFLPKIILGVQSVLNPVQALIKKWPRLGSNTRPEN